jgi:D-alanyl-D-alanine carboxypeptidase/D-alanyl-D-alanine-endopeptidase (penicillin-binding protein 4)
MTMTLALASGCGVFRDGKAAALPETQPRPVWTPEAAPARPDPAGPEVFASGSASVARLRDKIERALGAPELAGASQGIHIVSLKTGETFFSRDADQLLRPASCLKILTAAAALDVFGAQHVFKTPIFAAGDLDPETGRLEGSLLLAGQGDPSISGRYSLTEETTADILDRWAVALWQKGLRSVSGSVVADGRLFAGPEVNPTWEVGDLHFSYAAPATALAINDNCFDLVIAPAERHGPPASVSISPANAYLEMRGSIATLPPGHGQNIAIERLPGQNVIILSGGIGVDEPAKEQWRSIHDGNLWSAHVIQTALERRGIHFGEPPATLESLEPADRERLLAAPQRLLFEHVSRPLADLISIMNKPSQNFYAETLWRAAAAKARKEGSVSAGEAMLAALLRDAGVNPAGLIAADGSGLSWRDLATARQITRLLVWMERHPAGPVLYDSLPIAGVDGTLENRMTETPARGNVRAKTGYISKTRAMCGYATTRDGERVAFAILTNNYAAPTSRINALHDQIGQILAGFRR